MPWLGCEFVVALFTRRVEENGPRSLDVVVKVKDKASQFTVPQKLGLAYTLGSTSAVARQCECDNNTVRRLRMEVAQT